MVNKEIIPKWPQDSGGMAGVRKRSGVALIQVSQILWFTQIYVYLE